MKKTRFWYPLKNFKLFFVFLLFTLTFSFAVSCGDTITTDTTLTSDLTCSGTALYIGANNIVLDCDGYTITHTGSGNGIDLSGRSGVTIKNCIIEGESNNSWNYGIYLYSSSSNSLSNITTYNNGLGIFHVSGSSNSLSNITTYNNGRGIAIQSDSNSNSLSNITAYNNNGDGIYLSSS
ncbi:MAG: right-handed parallel beta-helix repeat-containing protein, partial [Candidatus Micrarchaeota archaeon]|nr:right-handed parallel beta-helix repeat-containing protein [Candidatus Micrarchaeota archaeon]